jgi:hypothetical protein
MCCAGQVSVHRHLGMQRTGWPAAADSAYLFRRHRPSPRAAHLGTRLGDASADALIPNHRLGPLTKMWLCRVIPADDYHGVPCSWACESSGPRRFVGLVDVEPRPIEASAANKLFCRVIHPRLPSWDLRAPCLHTTTMHAPSVDSLGAGNPVLPLSSRCLNTRPKGAPPAGVDERVRSPEPRARTFHLPCPHMYSKRTTYVALGSAARVPRPGCEYIPMGQAPDCRAPFSRPRIPLQDSQTNIAPGVLHQSTLEGTHSIDI